MKSWADVQREVIRRARERCEYCRMHQSLQGATFHIEHICPSVRGGADTEDNLELACPGCNLCKSDRMEIVDPETGASVRLFHPRKDQWANHLMWDGYEVRGLTDVGRTLIAAFDLNHARRIRIRQAEEMFGLFPP